MSTDNKPEEKDESKEDINPRLLEIEHPADGKEAYPVVSEDGYDWICATGSATDEQFVEYATDVYLYLSQLAQSMPSMPQEATRVRPQGARWSIDKLYGAAWNYYGIGAENYLAAWAYFPQAGWRFASSHFYGILADQTYCDSAGTSNAQLTDNVASFESRIKTVLLDLFPNLNLPVGLTKILVHFLIKAITGSENRIKFALQAGPFSNGLSINVNLTPLELVDPQTFLLTGSHQNGSDPRIDVKLYVRFYEGPLGENNIGSGDYSLRLTCMMNSPSDPGLVSPNINWTAHVQKDADAGGVFHPPDTLDLPTPTTGAVWAQVLHCCNFNNLSDPHPVPASLSIAVPRLTDLISAP